MLTPDRRGLLGYAAAGIAAAVTPRLFAQERAVEALTSLTGGITQIGRAERADRLSRAQAMMQTQGIDALRIETGASPIY